MAQDRPKAAEPWHLVEAPCDFCGSSEANVLLRGFDREHGLPGEFSVVVCCRCGLARTSPRPDLESLPHAYPPGYAPHGSRDQQDKAPGRLARWALTNYRGYPLGPRAPAAVRALLWPAGRLVLGRRRLAMCVPFAGEGRLLDFGCGSGGFVARMAALGWKAEGLDSSEEAVRAGRRIGINLQVGTLPGGPYAAESFDAVTMRHSLEHVPSPRATLDAAREILRPGGWLVVAVPSLDSLQARWFGPRWIGLDLPRHLTHFTGATLARHVAAAGLEVKALRRMRLPGIMRKSFARVAEETGSRAARWLARSRFATGLLSLVCLAAGQAAEVLCLAARPCCQVEQENR